MKINVRLSLAPSSCVQALAAMCEKDEQSLLLLIFAFFILAFYPFPFGAHGETGAENRTIIPSAARLATRLLASPAGFGRVVYFSLCVRALCSFGRGYNQPAEKEKKN
jgi:dolichol kinase